MRVEQKQLPAESRQQGVNEGQDVDDRQLRVGDQAKEDEGQQQIAGAQPVIEAAVRGHRILEDQNAAENGKHRSKHRDLVARAHQISCHNGTWPGADAANSCRRAGNFVAACNRRCDQISIRYSVIQRDHSGPGRSYRGSEIEIEPERFGRIEAARLCDAKHRDLAQFGRARCP